MQGEKNAEIENTPRRCEAIYTDRQRTSQKAPCQCQSHYDNENDETEEKSEKIRYS